MTHRALGALTVLVLLGTQAALARADDAATAERARDSTAFVGAMLWPPPDVRVSWSSPRAHHSAQHLKVLAFNDFHGNLKSPSLAAERRAGGAAVLAAYLEAAAREAPGRTLIVHAGDHVGASPPVARLLHNEPSIDFLNLLGNEHCTYGSAMRFYDARSWMRAPNLCNVIGTLGNHEFDRGVAEIERLLNGGGASGGPSLDAPYRGSRIPYVCANARDRRSDKLLLPPYAVAVLDGMPVGVIGAVLRATYETVPAWASANVQFLDEAESINRAAAELEAAGIHTLIVIIHQGMVPVAGPDGVKFAGPLGDIVARLDPDIDIVVSGHTHNYTNTLLPNRAGEPVLVTQAFAYGVAYADIDLEIDPRTRDVVGKSARIVPAWIDAGPGRAPDRRVEELTAAAERTVRPLIARVIGRTAAPITRRPTVAGESALGDLVADAQRAATHADMALMNPGGLRADLPAGELSWGDVLTLHPFDNRLVTLELTGAQIRRALEEQWPARPGALPRLLKTSGLYYLWDPARPSGAHVVAACDGAHHPLDDAKTYRVTVNDFLAAGGDGFRTFRQAPQGRLGPLDSEALAGYFAAQRGAVEAHTEGRIARTDEGPRGGCERG